MPRRTPLPPIPPAAAPREVPALRIADRNGRPVREDGEHVLYWMIAARRTTWNFALQRAVAWARRLDRPLVVLEPLRCGYPWASDRLHRFVLDGMACQAERLATAPVTYHPYVEPEPGAGRGLLAAWAERACVVVTDEFPAFFLPRMVAAAASALPVRLESVDGNGLLPLRTAERTWPTAYAFRRFLQRTLPGHLDDAPLPEPLDGISLPRLPDLPPAITRRWPVADAALLAPDGTGIERDAPALVAAAGPLAALAIDHSVPVAPARGGAEVAGLVVRRFLGQRLARYADDRRVVDPEGESASGLSPWLHFGHVSVHAVFAALARHEGWTSSRLGTRRDGKREGFWGFSPAAEAFLDELVTWREVGFQSAFLRDDDESYDTLPDWARATLAAHADDARDPPYSFEQLRTASTHDETWNAAQRQLLREGRIHNYLRMLWGKKILQWSPDPRTAVAWMFELNHRYALDGRDPNSASGILWCCGRYDRPWAPERPVFGTIRYMSSENTARKLDLAPYLARYGPAPAGAQAQAGAQASLFRPDAAAPVNRRGGKRRAPRPAG